ncbi:MAG: hypothetical protein U1E02_06860 [Hydrogenophaga sp.]|nr:hypothetical protein [Hydrogenophaga sp.]
MTPEQAANMARRQAEADTSWIARWDNQRAANRAAKNYTNEVASLRAYIALLETQIDESYEGWNQCEVKLNNSNIEISRLKNKVNSMIETDNSNKTEVARLKDKVNLIIGIDNSNKTEITRLKNKVNLIIEKLDNSNAEIARLNDIVSKYAVYVEKLKIIAGLASTIKGCPDIVESIKAKLKAVIAEEVNFKS